MAKSPSEKKAELEEKKAKIEKQIRSLAARESAAKRKAETRRKVLTGAAVLAQAEQSEQASAKLRTLLDQFLTRDHDRALFDLDPLPKTDPPSSEKPKA